MKVKFLMAHEEFQRGDVAELDDAKAGDLLCDGVVERAQALAPAPKADEPKAEAPEAKPAKGKK